MRKIKIVLVTLLIFSMFILTGCWNYQDVDKFAIVSGMAIDKGTNGLKYHITFEIADISQGSQSPITPIIIESEGNSLFEAVRNTAQVSSKTLYFSHCNLYLLSKGIAQDGILPILNWLNRNDKMRLKSNIAVSEMDTAKEVLLTNPTSENLVSYEIANMLNGIAKSLGKAPQIWVSQASDLLNYNGSSMYMPAVRVVDETSSEEEQSSSSDSGGGGGSGGSSGDSSGGGKSIKDVGSGKKTIPQLDGTSVFKNDKLIGFLSSDDSEYFMIIKNKLKDAPLYIKEGITGDGVTVEILESKTDITPQISGNEITMKMKIAMKASLNDDESSSSYSSETAIMNLENSIEDLIKAKTELLVSNVQKSYDSDIFGFGREVYKKDYDSWEKIGKSWNTHFSKVKVSVEPEVSIINTAVEKTKLGSD